MTIEAAVRRSALCVPAGDDHKLGKALAAGADEVVIDLEDAVAIADKDGAREALAAYGFASDAGGPSIAVRINAVDSPWWHRDLAVVVGLPAVTSVVVPKVESRHDLVAVERLLNSLELEHGRRAQIGLQALVETAAGIAHLHDIVSNVDRLSSLVVGFADLAASLGRNPGLGAAGWASIRDSVVIQARSGGVEAVDGPYLGVQDDPDFRDDVRLAADLGFDAKWVIHPRQIDAVNTIFTPAAEAVAHARNVLAALDEAATLNRGAAVLDGALVDEAMARAARRALARAGVDHA